MLNLKDVTLIGIDCVNIERLIDACDVSCKDISFGAVKMLSSLPSHDKRVIKIDPVKSTEEYSLFCIEKLHTFVDTKYMLIFQYDGFVLNASAWSENFLMYDYIGAPWYHLGPLRVGNGGFSLRSTKMMKFLSENYHKIEARIHPEDVFISRFARPLLEESGFLFADEETASLFSKEGNEHSVVWNGEFGFHGIKYTNISKWLKQNPEIAHKFTYELDDYASLMEKYPVYDGTVHTFRFEKRASKEYVKLCNDEQKLLARPTYSKHQDLSHVKIGHTAVFKRSGISFSDLPVPATERTIANIEVFSTFSYLRKTYRNLSVTPPDNHKFPLWKHIVSKIFPDFFCPEDREYRVFTFK